MDSPTNRIADLLALLSSTSDSDEIWKRTVAFCRSLGLKDVNLAEFPTSDYYPLWARLSMAEHADHEEYIQGGFIDVDPILHARADGSLGDAMRMDLHRTNPVPFDLKKSAELKDMIIRGGYDETVIVRATGAKPGLDRTVVLITGYQTAPAVHALGEPQISTLANLISAFNMPPTPDAPTGHFASLYEFLSEREHDILCYLANGLTNDQIAHRTGLAEVTVRFHIANARKKMRARTREQAVALAIARGLLRL